MKTQSQLLADAEARALNAQRIADHYQMELLAIQAIARGYDFYPPELYPQGHPLMPIANEVRRRWPKLES